VRQSSFPVEQDYHFPVQYDAGRDLPYGGGRDVGEAVGEVLALP
jgi:hypothetical protein